MKSEPFLVPRGFIEDRIKETEQILAEAKYRRAMLYDGAKIIEARIKQAAARFKARKAVRLEDQKRKGNK